MQRLLILLLLVNGSLHAQTPVNYNEAIEDVEVAIAALEECHPGLDIHLSKEDRDQVYARWRNLKESELTWHSFYTTLMSGIAQIGDGHTDLLEGERYRQEVPTFDKILPFRYGIIDERIFISEVLNGEDSIEAWSEILEINRVAASSVLKMAYGHTPSDGGNIGFKRAYNEKVLGLQFAKYFGATDVYDLKLRRPDGSEQHIVVNAVHDSVVHFEGDQGAPLEFEIDRNGNYAILTVNTFQYELIRRGGLDYHEFLKSSFKALNKARIGNLIIDLRENAGGDNILGLTLYSFLTDRPFKWMNPSVTKLVGKNAVSEYSNYPNAEFGFLKTHEVESIENGFNSLSNGIDSKEQFDCNQMYKGPGARPENISKYKFRGEVFVLTGGLTFSAAAIFSAKMYDSKRATLIGQETGGAHSEFCGGGFYKVTLPNSKFVLQIPFMKRSVSLNSASKSMGGTRPHHSVNPTVESLRNGSDPALEKALELIKERSDR